MERMLFEPPVHKGRPPTPVLWMNEVNPNLEALHTFFLQINDLATLEKCHGLNPTLLQDNDFMKVKT
jgi:hypothetical protein